MPDTPDHEEPDDRSLRETAPPKAECSEMGAAQIRVPLRRGQADPVAKATQVKAMRAFAEHLTELGDHSWHLVRERSDLKAVIGKEAGSAGSQRFRRWKRRVQEKLAMDITRPHEGRAINSEQERRAADRLDSALGLDRLPSVDQVMRSGASTPEPSSLSIGERNARNALVVDMLTRSALKPNRDAPLGYEVEPELAERALKASIQLHEELRRQERHAAERGHDQAFQSAVLQMFDAVLADHPNLRAEIQRKYQALLEGHYGE